MGDEVDSGAPPSPSRRPSIGDALRLAIREYHQRAAQEPIRGPESGMFPDSFLLTPVPIVPDAMVLRDNVLRTCRNGERTTLANATNAGLFRLFCAEHVVGEVFEHSEKWATEEGRTREEFLNCWTSEYLPLLRIIPADAAIRSLLSPEEEKRIAVLDSNVGDPDDVPSATLALALGALYLSKDGKPLRAVYGPDVDLTRHREWLTALQAAGNAGELERMINTIIGLFAALGSGAIAGIRRLVEIFGPWILLLPVAAGGALYYFSSQGTRGRVKSGSVSVLTLAIDMLAVYQEFLARFQTAIPATPTMDELATRNSANAVLTRACLSTLARSPMSDRSAAELASELRFLSASHTPARVRALLRSNTAFTEVWKGRWQVGVAWDEFLLVGAALGIQ